MNKSDMCQDDRRDLESVVDDAVGVFQSGQEQTAALAIAATLDRIRAKYYFAGEKFGYLRFAK